MRNSQNKSELILHLNPEGVALVLLLQKCYLHQDKMEFH